MKIKGRKQIIKNISEKFQIGNFGKNKNRKDGELKWQQRKKQLKKL